MIEVILNKLISKPKYAKVDSDRHGLVQPMGGMKVVKYSPIYSETLYDWRHQHKLAEIHDSILSDHGLVVLDGEEPLAMAWLFDPSGGICYLDFGISNPSPDSKRRTEAVDLLIDNLTDKAIELGYRMITTNTSIARLISRYKEKGWTYSDPNMTNLVRILWE